MKYSGLSNHDVAHFWAHQTQSHGNGSHMLFDGPTIYSYGRHFPIAKHIENAYILFTHREHSVTTAKHCSIVRSAIPASKTIVYVYDPQYALTYAKDEIEVMQKKVTAALQNALTARQATGRFYSVANFWKRNLDIFCQLANVPMPDTALDTIPANKLEMIQAKIARYAEQARIADVQRIARESEYRRKQAIEFFAPEQLPEYYSPKYQYMRIHGNEIVTTLGARVPIDHVAKAAPLVLRIIAKGETYHSNGHSIHLGPFVLDEINANGLVHVGCHVFQPEEVKRIAALLQKITL
jgi:hypothetical protein